MVTALSLNVVRGCDGILHLLGQEQIQQHADNSADSEARLHDERDGVEEPLETPVVPPVGEDVVKVVWDQRGAVAQGQARGEDESAAAVERVLRLGDDGHARHGDGAEEEGGHAAQDG